MAQGEVERHEGAQRVRCDGTVSDQALRTACSRCTAAAPASALLLALGRRQCVQRTEQPFGSVRIAHNMARRRFDAILPGGLARVDNRPDGGTIFQAHAEVSRAPGEAERRQRDGPLCTRKRGRVQSRSSAALPVHPRVHAPASAEPGVARGGRLPLDRKRRCRIRFRPPAPERRDRCARSDLRSVQRTMRIR
jgi:hypothetical protein